MTDRPKRTQRRQAFVEALLGLSADPRRTLRRLVFVLLGFEAFLIVMHLVVTVALAELAARTADGHIGVFDLGEEGTLGVWFSSLQLLVLGLACLLHSWLAAAPGAGRGAVRFWLFGFVLFTFMSIDETSVIHEMCGGTLARLLPGLPVSASMWWTVPYGLGLGVVFGFLLARFRNRPALAAGVVAAGAAWALAVLLEHVHLLGTQASIVVEEALEMLGATVLIWTLGTAMVSAARARRGEHETG